MKNMKKAGMWMVLAMIFVLFAASAFAQAWETANVDSAVDHGNSLVLDSSGNPNIIYIGQTGGLKHAYYVVSGGNCGPVSSWQCESADSNGGNGPSLAFDPSGNPHIAYGGISGSGVRYASKSGGVWSTEQIDNVIPHGETSLGIDPSGNPYVIYGVYVNAVENYLKYAKKTGSIWTKGEIEHSPSYMIGNYISLALDPSGNPHISYNNDATDTLKYAYYLGTGGNCGTGSSWHCEVVDSVPSGGSNYNSIAFDSSGTPHIAYTKQGILKYAYPSPGGNCYGNNDWHCEVVDSSGGDYPSLKIDSSGNPHITYSTSINRNWKYATKSGSTWISVLIGKISSASFVSFNSLALDPSGTPSTSYFNYSNSKLIYARRGGLCADYSAQEICDGLDNNCDGSIDEPFMPPNGNKGQACTAGIGACQRTGTYICKADGTGTTCNAVTGTPTTEICGDGIDQDCSGADLECPSICTLGSAQWSAERVSDGTAVTLTVTGQGCDGQTATFDIWESDYPLSFLDSDVVEDNGLVAAFSSGIAQATWTALYVTHSPIGFRTEFGEPEYYFFAKLADGSSIGSDDPVLVVARNLPPTLPDPFLIEPNGGESYDTNATVRWNRATDPYDDPLYYDLEYSTDSGGTFYPLRSNYGHIDKVEYNGQEVDKFTVG